MTNQPNDKQTYERLRTEVIDALLGASSPARNIPELKPLLGEYDSLVLRQADLKTLEAKITEVLPIVEQVEADVAEAEKLVLAEKKQLASFAGELGRAVFAGFQAGELPDQPVLESRKQLQAKIDALQQQRSALLAEEKSTFIDKTKQQAQQLALAGQIKIEELKIGSTDRALGEAVLASKEKLSLKCSHTESVLKSIADQQRRISEARDRHTNAVKISANRNAECAARLGRNSLSSNELKAELKELKSESSRNTKRQASIREELVDAASRSEAARQNTALGPKLSELARLQESIAANRPQFAKTLDSATDQFKKLPAGRRRRILIASVAVLGLLVLGAVGRGLLSSREGSQPTESAATGELSSEQQSNSRDSTQSKGILNSIGMKLVLIPKGTFQMGSPESEKYRQEDETQHQVTISKNYYLGMTEITQGQYEKVVGTNPSYHRYHVLQSDSSTYPVEDVSWDDAVEFCKKLSDLPEEKKAGRVYRLPTEAEWEYACRAGSKTAYSFGDSSESLSDYAWFDRNSFTRFTRQTHPVGEKKANAWGLHDMHGNVWEWCSDWYGEYPKGEVSDPVGPREGSGRVSRGGGWGYGAKGCRSAWRFGFRPEDRLSSRGFRVAMTYVPAGEDLSQSRDATKPSRVPQPAGDSTSDSTKFHYTLNGQSYTGSINKFGDGQNTSELIDYDSSSTKSALTINEGMNLITLVLGITGDRLHIGEGENGQAITLTCLVGGLSTFDPYDPKHTPHTSVTIEYYSGSESTDGTKWFGKPVSEIPTKLQHILIRGGNKTFVDFGVPESGGLSGSALYKNFSTEKQLALIRQNIGNSNLRFEIGNSSFRIDEDARRSLYLFDRAVAVVRYRMGARDSASRPTLGD